MVFQAVFEDGVFRPLEPIPRLKNKTQVALELKKAFNKENLRKLKGCLSPKEARAMQDNIKEGRRIEGDW